jgi:sortase A
VPSGQSAPVSPSHRFLLIAERLALAFGFIGLVAWGWFQFRSTTTTRHDLEQFAASRAVAPQGERGSPINSSPDQRLWSPTRVNAWHKAIAEPGPTPLAVLRIPKVRLEAPVLPGTDDRTLDRGLGHIEYTARPGTDGNSGIAGHRDSFFRALKDIARDDLIELDTAQMTDVYRVERTWIVSPDDVSVLDPTPMRALTLVTCYPFYYVGSAPKRFIVRAVRISSKPVSWRPLGRSSRSFHFS